MQAWEEKYLGVGNESWGCGGNMRPEYYSDLFRRYSVYCRNYDGNQLYKIASGASDYDYNWTKVLMDRIGNRELKRARRYGRELSVLLMTIDRFDALNSEHGQCILCERQRRGSRIPLCAGAPGAADGDGHAAAPLMQLSIFW